MRRAAKIVSFDLISIIFCRFYAIRVAFADPGLCMRLSNIDFLLPFSGAATSDDLVKKVEVNIGC